MTSTLHRTIAALSIAGFAAFACGGTSARSRYYNDSLEEPPVYGRTPLLAVVGLKEQRVTIYDAKGKMMEAPVSSGQNGLETPAGIYSVVQKEEDHHSNIYDDASMPFMERITWTGIALHAGVLPGYPASHGCVRMPEDFAEKLYGLTNLGMRVIVVREDIAPAEVPQPPMFTPSVPPSDSDTVGRLRATARTAFMDVEAAKRREKDLRAAASRKGTEAAAAARVRQAAQSALERAEAELKAAEKAAETAGPDKADQAEAAKAQAVSKAEAAQAQLQAAKDDAQSKADASRQADEEARAATVALSRAADTYEAAQQNLSPVSVFISRKTQRLYIRKNNLPVYESPVTIRDVDKPVGSHVYTALDQTATPGVMRWTLVSMYKDPSYAEPAAPAPAATGKGKSKAKQHSEPAPADTGGAEAALSRLVIPQEAANRIAAAVLPGSSLIISDEGPSSETGKDTDFVVVMSGEPQGGLAIRHHQSAKRDRDEFGDDPWFGRSARGGRSRDGGFPFFFSE
jgi:multidrug efflux pump subunit AcrA (membrane-fusion protein)